MNIYHYQSFIQLSLQKFPTASGSLSQKSLQYSWQFFEGNRSVFAGIIVVPKHSIEQEKGNKGDPNYITSILAYNPCQKVHYCHCIDHKQMIGQVHEIVEEVVWPRKEASEAVGDLVLRVGGDWEMAKVGVVAVQKWEVDEKKQRDGQQGKQCLCFHCQQSHSNSIEYYKVRIQKGKVLSLQVCLAKPNPSISPSKASLLSWLLLADHRSSSLFIVPILIIIKQLMKKQQPQERSSLSDFQIIDKIGQGSFSSVFKVRRTLDDKFYALKKVRLATLTPKEKDNALNEVRLLASIRSDFVLEYRDAFLDEEHKFLCIVMEWADGGDLQQMVKRQPQGNPFNEGEVWKVAVQVLFGLALLHRNGILHRDIKTANVFFAGGNYKLGDLNVSKVQEEQDLAFTQTGTPYYASPEIWRDEPYGCKADIWSYGCLLYEMCTFHPPFQGENIESLYRKIKKGIYSPIPQCYSAQLRQLIAYCLSKKVNDRPSADKLLSLNFLNQKIDEYNITLPQESCSFRLQKVIKFQLESVNQNLPPSSYESSTEKQKSKPILPCISLGKLHSLKKLSLKLKEKLSPNQKVQTMPSQNGSGEFQKVPSDRSINKHRYLSNYQSQGRIDRLPAINFAQRSSRIRRLSTQRKIHPLDESPIPKELDIIKQLRKKCQVYKNKLKKVNSSAECKPSKKHTQILSEAPLYELPKQRAPQNPLRKRSKKALKDYSMNLKDENKQVRQKLQIELQRHRCIHLKKKGKSYKSRIFA